MGKQEAMTLLLASVLADIRPELDIYNVTDMSTERVALAHRSAFRRIFYNAKGDMQVQLPVNYLPDQTEPGIAPEHH